MFSTAEKMDMIDDAVRYMRDKDEKKLWQEEIGGDIYKAPDKKVNYIFDLMVNNDVIDFSDFMSEPLEGWWDEPNDGYWD